MSIFCKVRLADIVKVKPGLSRSDRSKHFNRIKSKHVDFVLCDKNYDTYCVIERDDKSHKRASRIERDSFVDGVLKISGIPVVHQEVLRAYNVSELKEKVKSTTC